MPVIIIKNLKIIDVAKNEKEKGAISLRATDFLVQAVLKVAVVEDLGKAIGISKIIKDTTFLL